MPNHHDDDCDCDECWADENRFWAEQGELDDEDNVPPDDLVFDVSDIDDAEVTTPRPRITLAEPSSERVGEMTFSIGDRTLTVPMMNDRQDGSVRTAARAAAAINGEPGPW